MNWRAWMSPDSFRLNRTYAFPFASRIEGLITSTQLGQKATEIDVYSRLEVALFDDQRWQASSGRLLPVEVLTVLLKSD
ncbi:hypothetical protein BKM16_20260 [Pseudomonas amygdali pv. morsprunorum]|uniref:Uncharacterized protein n=1 Tax=Pseudomonas amygdali pv. lachrymans str. M301315 TaxID=629260 RepID=A0AAD0LUI0_PSEAV|nr:hypothetical protein BKM19_001070 [Pseudomonas amygdali pv. morsprunorum]AXH53931.1 hypothetical protein PLA107_000125 [Pseudomonas amygdali pv. lachrymans str. M301315]PWD00341.1 hypothetical protein CX658_20205 [Pseudomonas amygdali pv. lachrymans]KWS61521.1 hypothetical protein AL056_18715 [Pseudomonas amygdali pv. morsprunorum]KWS68442.1 hypothetical protein AL054_19955 [Pseudomonas amygdali pv. morsprunorum]